MNGALFVFVWRGAGNNVFGVAWRLREVGAELAGELFSLECGGWVREPKTEILYEPVALRAPKQTVRKIMSGRVERSVLQFSTSDKLR